MLVPYCNMLSVMSSHNQHLAVQLKWALKIVKALDTRNTRGFIDYAGELTWVRYIWENNGTQGSLNNHIQFVDNDGILRT
jgi:hypothetical protein